MARFFYVSLFFPEKPSEEELKLYKECYEKVCRKKDSLYEAMNNGHNRKELECAACNFLYSLFLLKLDVPKTIRKKDHHDFDKAKNLAKIILTESLNRDKPVFRLR